MQHTNVDKQIECENCTFVKTMLMLLVVFYHSILFWNGTWFTGDPVFPARAMGTLASWLDTFHIYGFTLVSGYLFYFLKEEKGKYTRFGQFVKSKAKRLLVPWLFVSVLWAAPVYYAFKEFEIISAAERFLLGTAPSQLWFLLMLFNVFLLVWPVSGALSRSHWGSVCFGLAMYGVGTVGRMLVPDYFQIWTACKYVVFFVAGFKLRQCGSEKIMRIPWYLWILGSIALFWLGAVLQNRDSVICKLLTMGVSFACNMVGALMAFTVLQKLAAILNPKVMGIVGRLSKYAMPVYLLHQQFVYLFIRGLNGAVNPYLHAVINFLGALLLSLVVSAILMKNRLTRFLIGEK